MNDSARFVSARAQRVLLLVALACAGLFLLGLWREPRRTWGGFLVGFSYFTGLALAGALFLSLATLAGARWFSALRRVPEAMASGLPVALLLGLALVFGVHELYEWSHAAVVAEDPILAGKAGWLNEPAFIARLVVYFALWIALARGMVRASRRRDVSDDPAHGRALLRNALLFLPVFAVTFSLASVDWIQSLEPHWFSTIFALVTLAGAATSGLAVGIGVTVLLRRRGGLRDAVGAAHLDDLGRLAIGFALFWAYVWYCQYMLIWYTDMPEETPYYALRMQGGWEVLTWASLALNWAIPFFALMPRAARRNPTVLLRIAGVMLAGQAVHLFLLIAPPLMGTQPRIGVWELAPIVGALALFFWVLQRNLAAAPVLPHGDPWLADSLRHDV